MVIWRVVFSVMTVISLMSSGARAEGSDKSMNFRISPIGLLIGYVNIDADFRISDQWTLGPTLSYWKYDFDDDKVTSKVSAKVFSIGARGNWYKNGVYEHSFYVSPVVQLVSAEVSTTENGETANGKGSAVVITGLAGYHWFWGNFNLNVGGGLSLIGGNAKAEVQNSNGTKSEASISRGALAFDFMLGLAF